MSKMLELTNENFKTVTINMCKNLKEKLNIMSEQMRE